MQPSLLSQVASVPALLIRFSTCYCGFCCCLGYCLSTCYCTCCPSLLVLIFFILYFPAHLSHSSNTCCSPSSRSPLQLLFLFPSLLHCCSSSFLLCLATFGPCSHILPLSCTLLLPAVFPCYCSPSLLLLPSPTPYTTFYSSLFLPFYYLPLLLLSSFHL